nr:MAG TPA: tail tube protein [Caudoviricetes sp.]
MAAGRIIGEIFGTPDYKLWVDWRSVVDNMSNSSLVTAEMYIQYIGSGTGATGQWSGAPILTIDEKKHQATDTAVDTSSGKPVLLFGVYNQLVEHDPDGYKAAEIKGTVGRVLGTTLTGGGRVEGVAAMDKADVAKPVFLGNVQILAGFDYARVSFRTGTNISLVEYSLNGGDFVSTNHSGSANIFFYIRGLQIDTVYSLVVRITKAENGMQALSSQVTFKTSKVYVNDFVLTKDYISVKLGETAKLVEGVDYFLYPDNATDKSLTVKNTNSSVCSAEYVDGAVVVHGKAKGTADLRLSVNSTPPIYGVPEFRVRVSVKVPVEGVSFNIKQTTLRVGDTWQADYTVLPIGCDDYDVELRSLMPSVATVDGSVVTAVAAGVAPISVVVTADEKEYTDVCEVTVVAAGSLEGYQNYYEPVDFLTENVLNDIWRNVQIIKVLFDLQTKEKYKIGALTKPPQSTVGGVAQPYGGTQLADVKAVLDGVETDMQVLNSSKIESIYYITSSYRIDPWGIDKAGVWRWLQILGDLFQMLTTDVGYWGCLQCTDGTPIVDGRTLAARGTSVAVDFASVIG